MLLYTRPLIYATALTVRVIDVCGKILRLVVIPSFHGTIAEDVIHESTSAIDDYSRDNGSSDEETRNPGRPRGALILARGCCPGFAGKSRLFSY